MHSPRHSEGERRMQPRTPCSASREWGGKRSILEGSTMLTRVRRAFLRSAGEPLLSVATVSIIRELAFVLTTVPELLLNRAEARGKVRTSHLGFVANALDDCFFLPPAC